MRIISKTRDYYDPVQKMGVDKSLVYVRKPEEVKLDIPALRASVDLRFIFGERMWIDVVTVGFCGHFYLMFGVMTSVAQPVWFTSFEEATELVISSGKTKREMKARRTYFEKNVYRRRYHWRSDLTSERIEDWLAEHATRDDDLFVAVDSPIFIVKRQSIWNRDWIVQKDAILKDVGFQKVKDPYTAFQEIAMYLGGPLAKAMDPGIDIDDETMAEIKGFDRKTSFRMDSPGKKRKRREKGCDPSSS